MYKVQLLLAGTDNRDALEYRVRAEIGRWSASASSLPGLRLRWGMRLAEDPFSSTEQGSSAGSFAIDAFVEAALPHDDPDALVDLVTRAAGRLGDAIDPARCAAVAGTEHLIFAGDRSVLLIYVLRRLPGLSHEQFCDHWLNRHAEFARPTQAERGYRQFHADLALSAAAAAASGVAVSDLDGIAEASYADVADFLLVMSRPEVAADAMEDEKRFIDHSRSAGALTGAHLLAGG